MSDETPARPAAGIASPCNRVCTVDRASRLCTGCLRTIDEITLWTRMSDAARQEVMAELPARAHRIGQRP
ncbi:putative Fe-S protein YdhL (DUF1289 family) [Rhodovulum iodosum]|uniref:Fe-S protein YdhL (DUF1289 family) n=1 Tax=Rhodovulum iodosum TaxID=68291 RepID=A0ABV3XNA6_9RHOB|nr:DUF1289 domain-containing protein [Rhodovulum robiginosum]RSK35916.1 DUF1289 domain-containing protein [Rhodovulum robiginosum]